jgi:hypothetical protein
MDCFRLRSSSYGGQVVATLLAMTAEVMTNDYCRAISAAPTPSPSSFWSLCMSTVTLSNCPENSNGAS